MKKIVLLSASVILFMSCSNDDKIAIQLIDDVQNGAVIRTLEFNNGEFELDDLNSVFSVHIEEQDVERGAIFEALDIYVRFLDNTVNGTNFSTGELKIKEIPASEFKIGGSEGLPRTTMAFTFAELLQATSIQHENVECKDQFLLRLDLRLTDGRSFSTGSASSIIIAFNTFFSSPYCYTINIVEPIDTELFTGTYIFESILDGPFGPTFVDNGPVEISLGHSNNVRTIPLKHNRSHPSNELPRNYEFSIVCDETIFQKNQLSSVIGYCGFSGAPILLGPGPENAPVNPKDDSVFELWFVEGYLGWDGECGFGTVPSRVRFTKQ